LAACFSPEVSERAVAGLRIRRGESKDAPWRVSGFAAPRPDGGLGGLILTSG